MPTLLTHRIELHERLRADRPAALAAACNALQPLAVGGRSDVFVYRTVAAAAESLQRNVFLLRLSLVERAAQVQPHLQPPPDRTRPFAEPAPHSPPVRAGRPLQADSGPGGGIPTVDLDGAVQFEVEGAAGGRASASSAAGVTCLQLTVCGVDAPSEEISLGLVRLAAARCA